MNIAALYEVVTQSIIADLENGAPPWLKPWKNGKCVGIMPMNAATGRQYRGINIPILWQAVDANCYPTHAWMTFKQAIEKGACVRKGEKSTHIVFTKQVAVKEDDDEKHFSMLKSYSVFNVHQIDGLPAPPEAMEPEEMAEGHVDDFIKATQADIRHGGNMACYVPSKDFVALPQPSLFKTREQYHATALHELTHWSGAEHRLNRDLKNRFGTQAYAAEELVAEMGAAFLCAYLNITGELRHSGYIGNWLKLLREDDRAIFRAASLASRAADYLRTFSEQPGSEPVKSPGAANF